MLEEGLVKKRRRKPLHRTMARKKKPKLLRGKPALGKRSNLRMGDELLRFSDFMGESTPRTAPPGAYSNDASEINWIKNKIQSFEPEYTSHMKSRGERHGTKPRRHREILELEKQMREKGGTPENHSWIKRD